MNSKLLNSIGLFNYTAGTNYNFRYKTVGEKVNIYMDEILKESNIIPNEIYSCYQIHSNRVENINNESFQDFVYGKIILDTDGLITNEKNIALVTKFADCTPIILFDPINKVQASVHSGWRGTSKKISEVAINKMKNDFNCKSENIYAFIGPSIDSSLYEVGNDVYEEFSDFRNRDQFFTPKENNKFVLDMKGINKEILLDNGIIEKNIEVSDYNTFTNNKLHSARRDSPNYGLNMIISIIK